MADLYFCVVCEKFLDIKQLTLVKDWSGAHHAVYRGSDDLAHILMSKARSKRKFQKLYPAPVPAPAAPEEIFVNVLTEITAETKTEATPELPVEPLMEEPKAEPEVEDLTTWKQQLRGFSEGR